MLMRHAKSSWAESDTTDIERTLGERGRVAAAKLGDWIERENLTPDQVIVSNAVRCSETWDIIATKLSQTPKVIVSPELYLAGVDGMLDVIRDNANADRVLVIGHQPTIGSLARELRVDPAPQHASFEKYPTGATTMLSFDVANWAEANFGGAELEGYITPTDLS